METKKGPALSSDRQLKDTPAKLITGYTALIAVYHLLWIGGIFSRLNIIILPYSHKGLSISFICSLVFLLRPATKGAARERIPWYDVFLAIIALVPGFYMLFFWETIDDHYLTGIMPLYEKAIAIWVLVMIFEAGRRTAGLAMPVIALCFFIYLFTAPHFPGFLYGRSFSIDRVLFYMFQTNHAVFGVPIGAAAALMFVFLVFARFLVVTGAGDFVTQFAFAKFGHVRGGPAKVAVVGSGLFGSISGSAVANVAGTGAFTIPMMKSTGYKPEFAAAVEAVSSNGGQIMPPIMGIVAFLIAEFLAIPYIQVCVAAVIPAILYFMAEFIMVDLEAVRLKLAGRPRSELPPVWPIVKAGWPYIIPPIALVVFLVKYAFTAPLACLLALLVLFAVNLIRKQGRMTAGMFIRGLSEGTKAMMIITPICALAGIVVGVMSLTAIGIKLSSELIQLSGGNVWMLLVLTAGVSFVMGMGLTPVPCYIILAVLVAPALVKIGVLPIAAHLFVFCWGIVSVITPPVALGTWVAAGIAEANPWKTGWHAIRLGIVIYIIPFMFVKNPAYLFHAPALEILRVIPTGIIGTGVLAAAIAGHALTKLTWIERLFCFASSMLLVFPSWRTDIIGFALIIPPLLWQLVAYRRARETVEPSLEEISGMGQTAREK
jgi:TRAP transporter 4TM/12TM fusion protein